MTRLFNPTWMLMLTASLSGSCSGGDGADTETKICQGMLECGGNPVGNWTIDESCFTAAVTAPVIGETETCEGTIAKWDIIQEGTFSIGEDQSFSAVVSTKGSLSQQLPWACLPGISSCSDLGASCTGEADTFCTCTVDVDETTNDAGSWTVAGNTMTITTSESEVSTIDFCVEGDVLTISQRDDEEGTVNIIRLTR